MGESCNPNRFPERWYSVSTSTLWNSPSRYTTGPFSQPITTTSPASVGWAAASPWLPGQSSVSAVTSPVFGSITWSVFRESSVPCVVKRVPSESSSATPWCGSSVSASVMTGMRSGVALSRWAESKVRIAPVPSPKRVVLPLWVTTWPGCSPGNVTPVMPGADS